SLSMCTSLSKVDVLRELTGLRTLDLDRCSALKRFAPLHNLLETLETLRLYQCVFEDLPSELCGASRHENVLDAVRAYYAEKNRFGSCPDEEVKVFVLGNGGVGKTELCRRLRGLPYKKGGPSTDGIEVEHLTETIHGRSVRLNLWDFGGQDIYHGTHHLFLH